MRTWREVRNFASQKFRLTPVPQIQLVGQASYANTNNTSFFLFFWPNCSRTGAKNF